MLIPSVKATCTPIRPYNSETTVIATATMGAYLLPSGEAVILAG